MAGTHTSQMLRAVALEWKIFTAQWDNLFL